jgi:hypothetical protein
MNLGKPRRNPHGNLARSNLRIAPHSFFTSADFHPIIAQTPVDFSLTQLSGIYSFRRIFAMKPPVGLIGLGLMGKPMGANLLKAGHELTVWNRTASRADELMAQGAKRAATPRDVAAASEVIVTIVSDPHALESVLWGESGVFS